MSDMRNVNNWVNKDCRSWAKTYLTQQLVGLGTESDKTKIRITSLDECTGDVDLNQRKGKLLAIYDVALKLSWEAQLRDGSKTYGTISVPEVAYDTDIDDYVFMIECNDGDLKSWIRHQLTPLLRTKFSKFTNDLIQNASTPPDLVQRRKAPVSLPAPLVSTKKEDEVLRTTVVKHSFDFNGASARDIYEALLDPTRAAIWTHGKPKVSKKIGSRFEFFDGNVHGILLQTTPGKSIIQSWRLKNWPKDHYSKVTLSFENKMDGSSSVNVVQEGVPLGQEDIIKKNWTGYYWTAIKDNYHQFQHLPIQSDPYNYSTMSLLGLLLFVILLMAFTAYQVSPLLRF
ncbi:hypothetical protein INT47_010651 [Mucor saturninus]|uniref:Activator of Hsp90 ATPase AHSA1-like N-terminal domain-containing protein n=1 Tax=Mucor saturninus TaxID=64648 RepID=A0A8H7QLL2_9FUNG|nr:hypothetical protein INT47_010651 [Mucor saturninus]